MCARVERARERLWAWGGNGKDYILSHWCPIRVMLTRQLFRQHSTFKYFIWAGPARQQQAHLETRKFLFFFILFGAAGHGLVIWFHRNWCVVHTCIRTPGAYIPQRPEVHPRRWRRWRQRLPARRERGKNISRRVRECFFWAASFSPYCILFLSFGFFGFLFYFILWWGSLSLCVAFSLEIASLVEATFRLGNRPNEK